MSVIRVGENRWCTARIPIEYGKRAVAAASDQRRSHTDMKSKLINEIPKTYVLVLDKGDEAVNSIEGFARSNDIAAAQIVAIGAFSDALLGFFDWNTKDYRKIPVREQVEVVSFVGDIALSPDGKPALHPHVVVSRADGSAMGGHLLEAHVRPTLEVVLTESPAHLRKRKDPESGLALIVT